MYKYAYWQTPVIFLRLAGHPRLQLVVSGTLIEEIRAVTARPKLAKYFPKAKVEQFLAFLQSISLCFSVKDIPCRCRDAKYDCLLELAVVSDADFLITGDNDLLVIGQIHDCKIVTAAGFESIHVPRRCMK